jgi:hypothetical protein
MATRGESFTGSERNPLALPAREFLDGSRSPYANLQELRDAMTADTVALIDTVALRRYKDVRIAYYNQKEGITVHPDYYAQRLATVFANHRYPQYIGFSALISAIYEEFAPTPTPVQLCDDLLVDILAARYRKGRWAALHINSKEECEAPVQQAADTAEAVFLTTTRHHEHPRLAAIMGRCFGELILPQTAAMQASAFDDTRPIPA